MLNKMSRQKNAVEIKMKKLTKKKKVNYLENDFPKL